MQWDGQTVTGSSYGESELLLVDGLDSSRKRSLAAFLEPNHGSIQTTRAISEDAPSHELQPRTKRMSRALQEKLADSW